MLKPALIIGLILAAAGGLFFWYSRPLSPDKASSPVIRETEERLEELRRIRAIRLDTSVFQDPLFRSLRESDTPSSPVITPGRANPFLSL